MANHEYMMQTKVQEVLQTVEPLARCFVYNLPPHVESMPVAAAVIPLPGVVDDETKDKTITMQVEIRASNEDIGLICARTLYTALKDYLFPYPGSSDTENGVICVAKTTYQYRGNDLAGQPIFSIIFELNSIF